MRILSPWIRWYHVIHITTYHILNTMAPYHTHPLSMNTVIPCNTYHILNTMPPYHTHSQSMYTVIPCNTYHNKSSVNKMTLKIINVRRYRRGSKRIFKRNCISIDWILVTHQETSSLGQPWWMARWRGEQEDISFRS